jgi:hypothetical protein
MAGLSQPEIDLASLAAQRSTDRSLEQLLLLARVAGLDVTLLVGGVLITGALGSEHVWAEHLDGVVGTALEGFEDKLVERGWPREAAESLGATFRDNAFVSWAEERANEERDHFEEMQSLGLTEPPEEGTTRSLRDFPPDVAHREIASRGRTPVLTLRNATISPGAAGPSMEVGTMRVFTAHISAWWPGRTAR